MNPYWPQAPISMCRCCTFDIWASEYLAPKKLKTQSSEWSAMRRSIGTLCLIVSEPYPFESEKSFDRCRGASLQGRCDRNSEAVVAIGRSICTNAIHLMQLGKWTLLRKSVG